jgi:hypothetical protein
MTLTPAELRTLADLAEKFAALAMDLAKANSQHSPTYYAALLMESVDLAFDTIEWTMLEEDTLAIVKAAEKAK